MTPNYRGHLATRHDDLRTAGARPRAERLRLAHCRAVFIEIHAEKAPEDLLRLMRDAGLYSPTTYDGDALRSIKRQLVNIQKT
jgi:hypothetical protein